MKAMYPLSAYASPREAMMRLTTDAFFTCQSARLARLLARNQREPVYRYLFTHALENDPELRAQRAVHTVEHVFFFPWQGRYRPTAADEAVQHLMVGHWSRFAATGTPAGTPPWPPVGGDSAYLVIGANPVVRHGTSEAKCDFWDGVTLPSPHL